MSTKDIDQMNEVQVRKILDFISKSNPDVFQEAMSHVAMATDPSAGLDSKQYHECLAPEMCSITFEQLNRIGRAASKKFGQEAYEKMTMHDINREIIKPQCKITRKPYAHYLNSKGIDMDVFCTHCWSENFVELLQSIGQAYESNVQKPNLWICAFALFQGDEKEIELQLGSSDKGSASLLSDAPFVRALRQAKEFLVIRNSTVDLYSRIWCVCELVFATEFGLVPANTKVVGPDKFGESTASVKDAKAFCQSDRKRILQYLLEVNGNYELIDGIVSSFQTHMLSARKERKVKSQKDVSDKFLNILTDGGKRYRKTSKSYIRKATRGETITTVLFGAKETENTVHDDDSYIVCGVSAFETYIITKEDFLKNYDTSNHTQIKLELPPYQSLHKSGFREYSSNRTVLAHKVNSEDIVWFHSGMDNGHIESESVYFFAPWRELMLVEEGDFLVTSYPADGAVYRIDACAFENTYSILDEDSFILDSDEERYAQKQKLVKELELKVADLEVQLENTSNSKEQRNSLKMEIALTRSQLIREKKKS